MLKKRLGIEAIEKGRFWDSNESLFKISSTLIIPEGCENIGYHAFWCCENLREVIIPKSVKEINVAAFYNCTSLSKVVIPESLEYIMDYAFGGCQGLEKIEIPKNVKELGEGAFYCCKNADIILRKPKKKFKNIGYRAFEGCKGVSYVKEETGS